MPRVDGGAVSGGVLRVAGVYRSLLEKEREQHARFGKIHAVDSGQGEPAVVFRRPRHLLDALEAGEPVTVPFWRLGGHGSVKVPVPRELRCWPNRFVVSRDDTVRLAPDRCSFLNT